jgi:hypothetical protein
LLATVPSATKTRALLSPVGSTCRCIASAFSNNSLRREIVAAPKKDSAQCLVSPRQFQRIIARLVNRQRPANRLFRLGVIARSFMPNCPSKRHACA